MRSLVRIYCIKFQLSIVTEVAKRKHFTFLELQVLAALVGQLLRESECLNYKSLFRLYQMHFILESKTWQESNSYCSCQVSIIVYFNMFQARKGYDIIQDCVTLSYYATKRLIINLFLFMRYCIIISPL